MQYVEAQFEKLGLKPAGAAGYLQPVRFETRQITESTIEIVRDGQAEPVVSRQEATLTSRGDVAPSVDAPMVFVGYGMSIPEAHYDDLAGLDLKGKIAVYINAAGPVNASNNVKSHYASSAERWAALKRAGAIGTATLPNPRPNAPNPDAALQGGAARVAPPRFLCSRRALTAGVRRPEGRRHDYPPRRREVPGRQRPHV